MIEPIHIIGLALMAVRKVQQTDEFAWKPTKQDVIALRAELKQYQPKVINGRKFYSFEQHLVKKGICSILEDGTLAVTSPEMYKREQDIKGLSDWIAEQDQKAYFQANPEAKSEWRAEIRDMFKEIKSVAKPA